MKARACSNIAFIKYWGKKDEKLKIPLNPSISMTMKELHTVTSVEFREGNDEFILNGEVQAGRRFQRVTEHLDLIRKKAGIDLGARVVSANSFPTGTGLASSASGFAALTAAACKEADLELNTKELSILSRQGSGSSARSFVGGFALWHTGETSEESYCEQIADENHWPELRNIIFVLQEEEKEISSTKGMRYSVATSKKLKERLQIVDGLIKKTIKAIRSKKAETLFRLIMEDSDRLHEIMEDTTPKLQYMTDESKFIRDKIAAYNNTGIKAAYTFDAGPNAQVITTEEYVDDIIGLMGLDSEIIVTGPGPGIQYL